MSFKKPLYRQYTDNSNTPGLTGPTGALLIQLEIIIMQ